MADYENCKEHEKQDTEMQEEETKATQDSPHESEPTDTSRTDDFIKEEAVEEGEEEKQEKKGFGKSRKKDKKEEAMKAKIDELEDKVKRQMAEFENFRRRTEKEKGSMFETGAKSVVEKILPVVDNFERGLATIPEDEKDLPFAEGMNMIYKQLMSELESIDVKAIDAVGTEFNPDFHNAVMQVESEEFSSGTVAQEMQKGYLYRDTVVRHSMVAVVQ